MVRSGDYLLGTSLGERERLLKQCEIYEPEARRLLDHVGIQSGWRAVDVGCGPLGIVNLLAERVGPKGHVVGFERDPQMLEWLRASLAERNLTNVEAVQGDATAIDLPVGSFDFAHERLVLVNVLDPKRVLSEMVALVRPGGFVGVQEVDAISWTCEPPHPAWDRLLQALSTVWRDGGNLFIGRQLPGLLQAVGLKDVGVRADVRVWRPGDLYQTLLLHFTELFRERMLARGLLTEGELLDLVEKLREHLNDSGTLVLHCMSCQAWGRKLA